MAEVGLRWKKDEERVPWFMKEFFENDQNLEALKTNNFSYLFPAWNVFIEKSIEEKKCWLTYFLLKSDVPYEEFLTGMAYIPRSCFNSIQYDEDIRIPNSVQWIDDYAFQNTTIPHIYIPTTVKYIADNAFVGYQGKIIYLGTLDEFKQIKTGDSFTNKLTMGKNSLAGKNSSIGKNSAPSFYDIFFKDKNKYMLNNLKADIVYNGGVLKA